MELADLLLKLEIQGAQEEKDRHPDGKRFWLSWTSPVKPTREVLKKAALRWANASRMVDWDAREIENLYKIDILVERDLLPLDQPSLETLVRKSDIQDLSVGEIDKHRLRVRSKQFVFRAPCTQEWVEGVVDKLMRNNDCWCFKVRFKKEDDQTLATVVWIQDSPYPDSP